MSINWGRQAVLSTPKRFFRPLNLLIVVTVQILIILPGLNLFSPDGTSAGTGASASATLTGLNAKPAPTTSTSQLQAANGFKKNPLGFESNRGQFDPQVKFLAQGPGYSLLLGANKAVLAFQNRPSTAKKDPATKTAPARVELSLSGANPAPQVTGQEEQAAKSHYFTGSNPSGWQTDVPHFSRVQYKDIYPGVDLVYYGNSQDQLEYDFIVAPGSDPAQIKLEFTGASSLEVTPQGALLLALPGGNLTQPAPKIYQEKDGVKETVEGSYRLSGPLNNQVSFDLKEYDPAFSLVIDPVIDYASYFGGGANDFGYGIAVYTDQNKNTFTYITGSTVSNDFPMQSGLDTSFGGGSISGDAFVSKFDASGTLLYSTYLGGSGDDSGIALAVDSSGNFYVTGNTNSGNFPFSIGAFQTTFGGGSGSGDAFVTKFNAAGDALVYSTYLGGSNDETAKGIALDSSGNAYVTGTTNGTSNTDNFPIFPVLPASNPLQGTFGGGSNDAYVAKFTSNGTVVYSSYLGGNGSDFGGGIAVDSSGNTYVTGDTTSTNFFILNPYQPSQNGVRNIFVAKLAANGTPVYSTYLGGSVQDTASGIAIDSDGNFIVTGTTISDDFPTKNAYLSLNDGFEHVFVTKFNANGTLAYSTYLGGNVTDFASGIAVDFLGNAYITGNTYSDDFPTQYNTTLPQTQSGGGSDAFITQFNADGTLGFSTYLGGTDDDFGTAIAVDTSGNAYLTGYAASTDFPVTDTSTLAGTNDTILVRLNVIIIVPDNNQSSLQTAITQASTNGGGAVAFSPSVTTAVAITGNLSLPANVSLTGRSCGPAHGQVQLTGSGNFIMQGGNSLTGLKLQGMKLTNIVSTSPLILGKANKVKCSIILGS